MRHLFTIKNPERNKIEHTKLCPVRRKSRLFWSKHKYDRIQFIQFKMWFTDSHFPFQKRPMVNLTYVWECFPGKVNITVVAESKQSSACPNGTTEQQNLNWKDTVVKSLLVEVCTRKTTKLFQIRNR